MGRLVDERTLLVLVLLVPLALSECYWNHRDPYPYFAGKTKYDDIRGDIRDYKPIKGCEPINVWVMVRHGTRHPRAEGMGNLKKMAAIQGDILQGHAEGRGEMCAQDLTNLKDWKWDPAVDHKPNVLTEEGYNEVHDIGRRFNEKFHSFLKNLDQHHFRPTKEQRTKMSAIAFTDGLRGDTRSGTRAYNITSALRRDNVLRPYKNCDKYFDDIVKGPQVKREIARYYETDGFQQMLKTVRKRIGVTQELTPENITGLYNLCRYHRAFSSTRRNPWCAAFSDYDLEIMEYLEDIHHFYRSGHGGGSVNAKLGEMALRDLYEKFESGNTTHRITGYFTHGTMIELIYSALGLFYDYPGLSGFERVKNRQWRTSLHTPFAANFVAILNRCDSGEETVQFFVNEIELHLCNKRVCTRNEFRELFGKYAHSNLEFCSRKKKK